ncbi:aminotransferase-like domain-containing protein [Flavobacterium daemonense]|uniref:aminotransferase-like domain-containing protein n=1 Tax=Flavobacterium daemonense TaxID=1393049 RepID=UPI0011862490|nr:PLP-dependent aminotransferase family protein [Flavobacterium daemonense]KAF2330641.1 PLP-dependent aminotransferase family protein [Flavobacterium daemonense]
MKEPVYINLANKIASMIEEGIYKSGDKLPSLRHLQKENNASIGTILQSFNFLIDKGVIDSRERSGYFVRHQSVKKLPVPRSLPASFSESEVRIDELLQKIHKEENRSDFVSFANAIPDHRLLPFNGIKRAIQNVSRDISGTYLTLEQRNGNKELREEISKRSFLWDGSLHADELIITNGAKEALLCCLKAVTQPGDTVLVQDPCYYGILQILECLDLKLATIPSDPETGIKFADVENIAQRLQIKACLFVSNFNNPDAASISTEVKKQLADFANSRNIPIIEDDLYGDIFFNGSRPDAIKTYDKNGWVMYCSSFTKTLVPGFRIGWCAPGRFLAEVSRVKWMHNGSTSNFNQRVVQQLLSSGTYDRHLQRYRLELNKNLLRTTELIEKHFPNGTKISRPNDGIVLWIELPVPIKPLLLYDYAIEKGISYAPGELFSAKNEYDNYLRLNYCNIWQSKTEKALKKLGELFCQNGDK